MKIFLLSLTILFFILRIKGMPKLLSKRKYIELIQKNLDKTKVNFDSDRPEKEIEIIKYITIILVFTLQCLTGLYYILIGTKIGVLYFTVLTVIQILTVIETSRKQLNMKAFSQNIEDHKFHRWYFMFNIVLDLVYYPLAMYLLLR